MNKRLVRPGDADSLFFLLYDIGSHFGKNGWHQATHWLKSKQIEID